jgi:hypothetical protein
VGAIIGGIVGGGRGAGTGAAIGAGVGVLSGAAEAEANARARAYDGLPPGPGYGPGPGNLVFGIQSSLNHLGYDVGPPDGVMGPRTAEAISQYQDANRLPVDGQPSPPAAQLHDPARRLAVLFELDGTPPAPCCPVACGRSCLRREQGSGRLRCFDFALLCVAPFPFPFF